MLDASEHGAIVIPTDIAAKIREAAELCGRRETPILEIARSPDFTLEKLGRGAEMFVRSPLTKSGPQWLLNDILWLTHVRQRH